MSVVNRVDLGLFAAIGLCIKALIEGQLVPLQEFLGNGSEMLNSTNQEFVSG